MDVQVFGAVQLPFTHDGLHITVDKNNYFIIITKNSFYLIKLLPKVAIGLIFR
jgi:hypothetical protein